VGRSPADARFLVAFGDAVRAERERKGLSQEDLGFEAELDRTYVSGIERGVRNPTVVTIRRLAAALDVAPSRLMRAAEGG
jgi:transcriptional regulator with XRE-family HTH domain